MPAATPPTTRRWRRSRSIGIAYEFQPQRQSGPRPSGIGLPLAQIAPVVRRGVTEVPVSLIEDRAGCWRNVQICALSVAEMRAALDHAVAHDHAALDDRGA
ncbi:hypothetical protein AB5I41_29050 [Sphingomonas sp. MMS24-JH45]